MKKLLVAAVAALTMLALCRGRRRSPQSQRLKTPVAQADPRRPTPRARSTWRRTARRPTNAAAGADISGAEGQTFFVGLVHAREREVQCQGGSPRFVIVHDDRASSRSAATTSRRPRMRTAPRPIFFTARDARGGRPAGRDSDGHDPVRQRPDRRSGHGRPDEDHVQRQAAEGHEGARQGPRFRPPASTAAGRPSRARTRRTRASA